MSKYYPAGGQTYTLGSSIGSTDTSILLSSFTEPVTNTPYTMALLNTDIAFGTLGPRTTSSEFISFTGITQNSDGTALLTGVTRGLAKKYPFTTSASYKLPHSGQSVFILSDAPQVFQEYASIHNDLTIEGLWTFNQTPLGINPSAAPDASTTVKGLSKMSYAPVLSTNPIAVGDNDPRVPTQGENDALVGTSGTPGSSNKYVTNDDTSATSANNKVVRANGSGKIDIAYIDSGTTANKIVALDGSAKLPVVDGSQLTNIIPILVASNGATTYDMATASGNKVIAHGLSRAPKQVKLRLYWGSGGGTGYMLSDGAWDASGNSCTYMATTTLTIGQSTATCIFYEVVNGGNRQTGTITVDGTNITIAFTKTGSPSGTGYIQWEAIA